MKKIGSDYFLERRIGGKLNCVGGGRLYRFGEVLPLTNDEVECISGVTR